jgi:NtrC-family two-component system response regulator AlgB
VAAAESGTLFLDEIGEMPLEMQPALLRLLQDRVYERVGENRQRHANVRIVGATSRALAAEVRAGRFRGDLYCRLNVIGITLPGLCERRLDQPKLADGFRRFFARRLGKNVTGFSPEVAAAFARHSWPGNLREMSNVIERAVIVASGDVIEMVDLPDQFGAVSIPAITRVSAHRT